MVAGQRREGPARAGSRATPRSAQHGYRAATASAVLSVVVSGALVAALVAGCTKQGDTASQATRMPAPTGTAEGVDLGGIAGAVGATGTTGPGAESEGNSGKAGSVAREVSAGGIKPGRRTSPKELVQWAVNADATSSYGTDKGWTPSEATGEPDTDACGDTSTAWASAKADERATLTVEFGEAVVPTQVAIVETFNPGQIVRVTVKGPSGRAATIYEGDVALSADCPATTTFRFRDAKFPVDTVEIIIDQSQNRLWDEIDAVQLVGLRPTSEPN